MLRLLAISVLALSGYVAEAQAEAEAEPFIAFSHTSDILRGCPLRCSTSEPTADRLTIGGTITVGRERAWEIDLQHGFRAEECRITTKCEYEPATNVTVRYYFLRKKR